MITYKSATNFDRELVLEITEQTRNRNVYYEYRGFANMAQAEEFARWWTDNWRLGYSGSARAYDRDGQPIVLADRWDSCD